MYVNAFVQSCEQEEHFPLQKNSLDMDTMVETAMTICMSCRQGRCCTLLPQWWSYITRQPTPKDIILDMLMILNGNQYTCLVFLQIN